jgi:5-formyltetrahydrofolate cyclo-ligase
MDKEDIRRNIWRILEERGEALPPKPIVGRIPNFKGADKAAYLVRSLREYAKAETIFTNPDSPQRPLRELILRDGKTVVMATPRLREGFLILNPNSIPEKLYYEASTIRGAFKHGRKLKIREIPTIDFKVVGSVAVSLRGERIGKGSGYSELEYGILRELNRIGEDTPIITTVHELQIVENIPQEEFDVPVDYIVTFKRIIKTERSRARPNGIIWRLITDKMMMEIPILKELKQITETHANK